MKTIPIALAAYLNTVRPHLDPEAIMVTVESLPEGANASAFAVEYIGQRAFLLGCEHGNDRHAPGAWSRIADAMRIVSQEATVLGVRGGAGNDLLGAFQDGYNTNTREGELPVRFV